MDRLRAEHGKPQCCAFLFVSNSKIGRLKSTKSTVTPFSHLTAVSSDPAVVMTVVKVTPKTAGQKIVDDDEDDPNLKDDDKKDSGEK